MPWVTPKTNWVRLDKFNVDPDWNRIKGNMEYVQAQARPLFGDITFAPIPNFNLTVPSVNNADSIAKTGNPAFPTVSIYNTIENALQTLMDETYDLLEFLESIPRVPNGRVWDFEDLNRIESMQLRLKELLDRTAAQRQGIPFKLGGGYFAEGVA